MVGHAPVTRGVCQVGPEGQLLQVDERRQVMARPDGGFTVADGKEPSTLSPEARVSMNLWGFTPAFHGDAEGGHGCGDGSI